MIWIKVIQKWNDIFNSSHDLNHVFHDSGHISTNDHDSSHNLIVIRVKVSSDSSQSLSWFESQIQSQHPNFTLNH